MARADDGKLYVGTRGIGRVYEITDNGGQRTVRGNTLYGFAIDKVLSFDDIATNPDVAPVDMTKVFNLPPEQRHNWQCVAFGPDGKLYVPFGAPCNICVPGQECAQIRRYNADGSGMEVIARGVRSTVGFDWHPVTKELWFTDHGRDWMGDDTPDDELNRMSRTGQDFGFPYCHARGVADRDIDDLAHYFAQLRWRIGAGLRRPGAGALSRPGRSAARCGRRPRRCLPAGRLAPPRPRPRACR